MKKSVIWLISLLLVLCLVADCAFGRRPAATETMASATAAPTPAPAPTKDPGPTAPEPSAGPAAKEFYFGNEHADVHFRDMHWEIYDMEPYRARAEELSRAASPEEAETIFNWLVDEYTRIRTYSELAWIDFYAADGQDDVITDACQHLDDSLTEAGDILFSAASKAISNDTSKEFSAFLGEDLTADLEDYEDMTDRESELLSRETELKMRYRELSSQKYGFVTHELSQKLGEIFMELVRIRTELARIHGYDSYAQYAYENTYGRDYTPGDAAALCEKIKPYARVYFRECYYSGAFYVKTPSFTPDELMDLLREYAPRFSPGAEEAQRYMEGHGLCFLESSENVSNVGFTTLLPQYNAPFLFDALFGVSNDVTRLFHEFGHYCEAYLNPEPDRLGSSGSYDVFEIHSTSMEALMLGWYDEIFGEEADLARIHALDGLLDNVVSGCLYDEFLQYAYSHPDMTVDELNDAYRRIASSYGVPVQYSAWRYAWADVSHNFESPFYYISYAASGLATLQILSMARSDRDAAIDLYTRLVGIGAYEKTYREVLSEVGLTPFTEGLDGSVGEAFRELQELCEEYESSAKAA